MWDLEGYRQNKSKTSGRSFLLVPRNQEFWKPSFQSHPSTSIAIATTLAKNPNWTNPNKKTKTAYILLIIWKEGRQGREQATQPIKTESTWVTWSELRCADDESFNKPGKAQLYTLSTNLTTWLFAQSLPWFCHYFSPNRISRMKDGPKTRQ